ncbi:MAG: PAS domain S-box protein, partial [Methylotenera sp.]|uniref:sensor domain-containing diguanylate cyclase n=1 Tax=Methylotenera sp. TaxID=2051956 RepID=UPI0024878A9E
MASLDTSDTSELRSLSKNEVLNIESPSNLINPYFSSESILKLLDQLPSMVGYWDKNLRNRFVNKAYEAWFSCKLNEIAGKHISEVIGKQLYELNLPYIEAVLKGVPQEFERAIPSVNGTGFRYSLANYIPDIRNNKVEGFYALVTDVSAFKIAEFELRNKQEALELSEKRYRLVVEAQTELISRLKADGTYTFVNDAFCRFFGRPAEKLIGSKWQPVVFPDDLEKVTRKLGLLSVSNPVVKIENRVIGHSGQVHWMQFINIGVFNENGSLTEIQSVGRDITEQKLDQNEIKALAFSDSLTGLPNRRFLLDRLNKAISFSSSNAELGALLFIDLDYFKSINDQYGHDYGACKKICVNDILPMTFKG